MKVRDFKIFDLLVLCILAVGIEFLGYFLVEKLESSIYLSFALIIGVIALVRWGLVGTIVFVLSGIPLMFLKEGSITELFFYEVFGNLFICIPFIILIKKKRDSLVSNLSKGFFLFLGCIMSLSIGKGIILAVIDQNINSIVNYFSASLLVFVINALIFMLLIHSNSELIRDMDSFLGSKDQEE